MLNLVQLQERLRDVPMQALMTYANGANPQVPPFLALGELNRRKKMQESAAAEQAQQMEGAPTVKQQIEQAAGLMALQGNRQQQAARQQQGIQAAMPMAAPNTTTSEPAQLAGGGFIEDIVVPRDYQAGGGVFDPEDLKRTMLRETMQNDVKDIPKELMSAVARAALRRRPGIAGVPLPANMFKRSDYAGGGIVAFAGPEGSFVERGPGFYQLEEELPEDERKAEMLANLPPEIRAMLQVAERQRQMMSPEAVTARRKAAGLPTLASELPDTGAKTLEELRRQKAAFDQSDDFASRLLALTPGRRFGTGETGRGLVAYEKERTARGNELGRAIATAEDLRERAKMDFAEGRFREGEAALAAANKVESDIAAKIPEALYKKALREQAEAGRTSTEDRAAQAYLRAKRAQGDTRPDDVILNEGYINYVRERGASFSRSQTYAESTDVATMNMARDNVDNRLKDAKSKEFRELNRLIIEDRKNGTNRAQEYKDRLYREEAAALQRRPAPSSSAPTSGGGRPPPPPPGFVPQQ